MQTRGREAGRRADYILFRNAELDKAVTKPLDVRADAEQILGIGRYDDGERFTSTDLQQGLAEGETRYDEFEKRLAAAPVIAVPTITLESDANGAPHADPSAYAMKFSGKYAHRTVTGGVGHNLPQEAPQDFAQAVIDVDKY